MNKEINGCKNVLTMIDRTTNWPEAVPLPNTEAQTVAWHFYNSWVKNLGVPKHIITDRGKQFESELYDNLCKLLQVKRCRTTSYHPQSNAKIERFHKTFKEAIMATSPDDWYTALPTVLLVLRNSYKEDAESTPAELLFGKNLTLPNELTLKPNQPQELPTDFAKKIGEVLNKVKSKKTKTHGERRSFVPKELLTAKYVFMKEGQFSKKGTKFTGPFEVKRIGNKTFDLLIGSKIETVSIDRLKAAPANSNKSRSIAIAKKVKDKKFKELSREPTGIAKTTASPNELVTPLKEQNKNIVQPNSSSGRVTRSMSSLPK